MFYINETHINKCSNSIGNCEECENNNTCTKCQNEFYIINDNPNFCFNISLIPEKEYYSDNNKTSFYLCNNSKFQDVINCKECTSKTNCSLCQDKFTFINGNKSLCVEKEKLENKYIQDPFDISNFIKCEEKFMNNCNTCNDTQCLSCIEEYIFLNGNYSECFLKSSLNLSEYFTKDNFMYYYCNDDLYKERPECKGNSLNISENPLEENTLNSKEINSVENLMDMTDISSNIISEKDSIQIPLSSNDIYDIDSTEFFIESTESEINKHIDSNLYDTFAFQTEEITSYPKSTTKNTEIIPYFELFVLQIRIIGNKLKIYAFVTIKIENLDHITISIDLYKSNITRNLQETHPEKLDIYLYINETSNIQPRKIFELTSKEEFGQSDRVVINKQKYFEYEMKLLNEDIKILDTQENEKMINNKEVIDLSNSDGNSLHNYTIVSSSSGCKFDLISKDSIEEENQDIFLNFTEKDDNNKRIEVKCSLSKDNGNKIPCSLEQTTSKTYTLVQVPRSTEKGILFIGTEDKDKTFQLNCQNEKSEKESNFENIILIIGVLFVVIVITVIITVICCKIKKVNRVFINEGELPKYMPNNDDSISEKDIDSYYKRRYRKRRKFPF